MAVNLARIDVTQDDAVDAVHFMEQPIRFEVDNKTHEAAQ
jgi:hypothetical protein